jgi:CO/xanthine dehydrogenase Mo-binding subunit
MRNLKYVGSSDVLQVDALDKVLGRAKYIADMQIAGMLHAKVLRSPLPHARIKSIDTSPALAVKGVIAAITSADFVNNGSWGWPIQDAYIVAHNKVRYVGDPIAVVAAETPQAAMEGIKAIILELEPLPVISDPRDALLPNSPLIPDESPTGKGNLCNQHIVRNGDVESLFSKSPTQIEAEIEFQHQEHAYIETEGSLAIPAPDGSLTIFANDQSPFINRGNIAQVLGLDPSQVRVIQPPVGGSFGGKDDINYQNSAQVAKLAMITNRPVRLILTREESMAASYKREAMRVKLKIGASSNGDLKVVKANLLADSGAYSSMTPLSSWRATMHAGGAYRYQAAQVDTDSVYTNNGYCGAFRGFGNNQSTGAVEVIIDELAEKFNMDPIDFRLQNVLKAGDQAFTGNTLKHEPNVSRCLDWVRQKSNWDQTRAKYAAQPDEATVRRGLGVACYFHGSGLGGEGTDYAISLLKIEEDDSITLQSGLTDYGQGSRTVFTIIAAETMCVEPTRIQMLRPDTHTAEDCGPTVASRASIVGGNATRVAAEKISQMLNLAAASYFDCDPTQIHRVGERFIGPQEEPVSFETITSHARSMGFQLSARGYWQIPKIEWDFDKGTGIPYFTYSYGAQVADVEVNRANGKVKVHKIWAVHDGGRIIYPKGAKGQLLGGIAQGIGYALTEGFTYKNSVPQKLNFDRYTIPTSMDMPEVEIAFLESELPEGPYGAKNIAEPTMISTPPAIANAVYQACGFRTRLFPIPANLLIRR